MLKYERVKIDPKIVKAWDMEIAGKTFRSIRKKMDWTKSEGSESGWKDIEELADSIKKNGMLHTPLVAELVGEVFGKYKGDFRAVQGYRRIRSAVLNKEEEIEVNLVKVNTLEELEYLDTINFKENYTHKNISDYEISEALSRAWERHPEWTLKKLAEVYGVNEARVSQLLAHRDFIQRHKEEYIELVNKVPSARLTEGDAKEIRAAARELTGISTRATRKGVVLEAPPKVVEVERKILETALKTKVHPVKIAQIWKQEKKKGVEITAEEAAQLAKKEGVVLTTPEKIYVSLELSSSIEEALKKWKKSRDPNAKVLAFSMLIEEYLEVNLREQGWLQ